MKVNYESYNLTLAGKAQKASIKEELLLIFWHPSRYLDWCMSEDEKKKNRKIVGINMDLLRLMTRYKNFF